MLALIFDCFDCLEFCLETWAAALFRSYGVEACLIRPAISIPDGGRPGFGGRLLPTDSELRPVDGEDGDFDVLVPLLGDITVTDSSDLLRLLDAIPSYVLVLR